MRVRETVPGKYVDIWLDNGTWITVFERKDGDQDGTLMIGVNSAKGEVGDRPLYRERPKRLSDQLGWR